MIKTLNLDGTVSVVIDAAHAHIRNDSEDTRVCVSTRPDPVEGADGVLTIPPGQAATLYNCTGTVYLDGIGPVVVVSSNYAVSPFKCAPALISGSSGGGSVLPVEPVLRAGSVGYYIQQQYCQIITDGIHDSVVRHLVFIPQDLTAFLGYSLPNDNPLYAAIDYNCILRTEGHNAYPPQINITTTAGETVTEPINRGFWTWNRTEADITADLYPDAVNGDTPYPPVQLDHVSAQGAYIWLYGNFSANETYPVVVLTDDVTLPLLPPEV